MICYTKQLQHVTTSLLLSVYSFRSHNKYDIARENKHVRASIARLAAKQQFKAVAKELKQLDKVAKSKRSVLDAIEQLHSIDIQTPSSDLEAFGIFLREIEAIFPIKIDYTSSSEWSTENIQSKKWFFVDENIKAGFDNSGNWLEKDLSLYLETTNFRLNQLLELIQHYDTMPISAFAKTLGGDQYEMIFQLKS
ncbi:hypothetical protein AAFX24_27545 [Vibrio mediterranei]